MSSTTKKGKRGKGTGLDNDTRTFISSMEATAKKILTKHHKNRMADAARAKAEKRAKIRAEKAAKRAWTETGAPQSTLGEGGVFTIAPNASLLGMPSAFEGQSGFNHSYGSMGSSGGLSSPIVTSEGPAPHVGGYGPESYAGRQDRGPGMGGSVGRSGFIESQHGTVYGTSEIPLPHQTAPGKMEETPYPFHMEGESLPPSVMHGIHRQAKSLRGAGGVSPSAIGTGSDPNAVAAAVAAKLRGNQSEASLPPLNSSAPGLQASSSDPTYSRGHSRTLPGKSKSRGLSVSLPKVPAPKSKAKILAGMEKLASSPLALVRSKAGKAAAPVTAQGLMKAGRGKPDFKVTHTGSGVALTDMHLSVPGATARSTAPSHASTLSLGTSASSVAQSNGLVSGLTSGAVGSAMKAGMKEENEAGNARSSMERRICEACWSQPTDMLTKDASNFNGDIRSLAQEALVVLEKQGPTSWSSEDIRAKYRDEEVRLLAHAASVRAAEEAAQLEREEGVIVPVVVVPPHSMHSLFSALLQRENRASTKRSRDRVALKKFHSNVRTVWLSGDTPHNAPLPWQNLPYSGSVSSSFPSEAPDGGVPGMASATLQSTGGLLGSVAMLPSPPLPDHVRRSLRDRRDESAIQSGYHLIQSVSLSRAMAGAYVTSSPEDNASSQEVWAEDVPEVDVSGDWPYWEWNGTPGLHPTDMEAGGAWLKWFAAAGDPQEGRKPSEGTGWNGYMHQALHRKRMVQTVGEERGVTRSQRLGEYLPTLPATAQFSSLSLVPWFIGAVCITRGRLAGQGTRPQDPVPAIVRVFREMEMYSIPPDDSPMGVDADAHRQPAAGTCVGVVVQVDAGPGVTARRPLRLPDVQAVARGGNPVGSWVFADLADAVSLSLFRDPVEGAVVASEVRIPLGRFLDEAQQWAGIQDLLHIRAQELRTESGALDLARIRAVRKEARLLASSLAEEKEDTEEKESEVGKSHEQGTIEGAELEEEKKQKAYRAALRSFKDKLVQPQHFLFKTQEPPAQSSRAPEGVRSEEVQSRLVSESQRLLEARTKGREKRKIPELPWVHQDVSMEEWEKGDDDNEEEKASEYVPLEDAPLPFGGTFGVYATPAPVAYDASMPRVVHDAILPLEPPQGVVEGLLNSVSLVVTGISRPYPPRGSLARVSVVSVEGEPDDVRASSGQVVGYVPPVTARGVIRDGQRLVGEEKAQELRVEANDWEAAAAAAEYTRQQSGDHSSSHAVSSEGFLTPQELKEWEDHADTQRSDWTIGHRITEFYVNHAYRWGGEVVRASVAGVVDGRQSTDMNWLNSEPELAGPWRQWWRYMDTARKLEFLRRVAGGRGEGAATTGHKEGRSGSGNHGASDAAAAAASTRSHGTDLAEQLQAIDAWVEQSSHISDAAMSGTWPVEAFMGRDAHVPSDAIRSAASSARSGSTQGEGEEKTGEEAASSSSALFADGASLAVKAVADARAALRAQQAPLAAARLPPHHPLWYSSPPSLPFPTPPQVPVPAPSGSSSSSGPQATLPWLPMHMRDAALAMYPHGRLPDVVVASGEAGKWGAVPGVTVLGRMDIIAGVFVKDSGVSTTEGVVARVIAYSSVPRTVGALQAEEFEVGGRSLRKKARVIAKTVVPEPRPEFWPRFPVAALISPSRASSLYHDMDKRRPFRVTLVTDAAVPVYDATAAVEGHIRLVGDAVEASTGRRLWSAVHAPQPNPRIRTSTYGIRQEAAVGSAATLWGERFTWHSDFLYKSGFTHSAKDFLYVVANPLDVGPNVPNTYILRLRYETVRELESSSLEEWRMDERQRQAQKEIREQEEAAARGAEALKKRREERMRQRALLAAQWREKHLRKAARMRGKSSTLALSRDQWRAKRLRPGARVMARFGAWERWVIFAPDSGNSSDGDDVATEKYEEVWYYNPEQDLSSYDAPKEWPETKWLEDVRQTQATQRTADMATLSTVRSSGPRGLASGSYGGGMEGAGAVAAGSSVTSDAAMFGNATTLVASSGDPEAREGAPVLAGPRLDPSTGVILGLGEPDAERAVDPDTDIYRFAGSKRGALHALLVEAYSRALRRWIVETAVRGSLQRPKRARSQYASTAAAAAASEGVFKDVSSAALMEGIGQRRLEHIDDIWREAPPKDVIMQALEDEVVPPVKWLETAAAGKDGSNLASDTGAMVRRHVLTQRLSKEVQRKAEKRWERQTTGSVLADVDKDPEMQSLKSLLWEMEDEAEEAGTKGATALERDLPGLHTNWRKTGRFDLRIAFRAMDRDRDGYLSVRDFGLATGGDSLQGEVSAAEALASHTPENAEATAALMTGVLPYLVDILENITPPQLRGEIGRIFPSVQRQDLLRSSMQPPPVAQQGVLPEDREESKGNALVPSRKQDTVFWANDPRQYSFLESSMFGAAAATPFEEREEITDAVVRGKGAGARVLANLQNEIEDKSREKKAGGGGESTPPVTERDNDDDAVDTVGPVASVLLDKLADLITPAVRYDVFQRMKRPRLPQFQRDKFPNKVSFEEFIAFVSGDSGGYDWFGVPLDRYVARSARPLPFGFTAERQELVHGIGQWLGPVDEASNDVYYVNTISGMSVWEKPTELITAESSFRNLCVTLVEKELREEKREYSRILQMQRQITLVRLESRANLLVNRFRTHLEAMRTQAHRQRTQMRKALAYSRRRRGEDDGLSDVDEEGSEYESEYGFGEEKEGEATSGKADPFSTALKTVLGSINTEGLADASALSRLAESLGNHPALVNSLARRLGLPTPRSEAGEEEKEGAEDFLNDSLLTDGASATQFMATGLSMSSTASPGATLQPEMRQSAYASGTRAVHGTWRGRGLETGVPYTQQQPRPGWDGTWGSRNVPALPDATQEASDRLAQRRPAAVQQHRTVPGVGWRTIRPPKSVVGLRERALEPRTMDARLCVGLNSPNTPQLVGLVDPAQVTSYTPELEFYRPQTHLVQNITRDSEALESAAKMEALLGAAGGGPVAAGFAAEEKEEKEKEEEEKREATVQAFLAVQSNKYERLEEILFEGIVPIEARDENGNTLLLVASQNGNKRISKLLLRKGANINAQNLRGNTVLHYTRAYKFMELFEYLQSKGADDSLTNGDGLTCYEGLEAGDVENLQQARGATQEVTSLVADVAHCVAL